MTHPQLGEAYQTELLGRVAGIEYRRTYIQGLKEGTNGIVDIPFVSLQCTLVYQEHPYPWVITVPVAYLTPVETPPEAA